MASFGRLGRFRIGQWTEFRRFLLQERRDAALRISVIQAELARIGTVEIDFDIGADGNATEKRAFITITPLSSTLGKLMQAYVGMGGNPFDVSMFLTPGSTTVTTGTDGAPEIRFIQPGGGVLHAKSGTLSFGPTSQIQGDASLLAYSTARVGGNRELGNEGTAVRIARARRWVEKEIRHKRNALEERIIRQCDLREQLVLEIDEIVCAVAESTAVPITYSAEGTAGIGYLRSASAPSTIAHFDGIIWVVSDQEGTLVADTETQNEDGLAANVNIMSDAEGGLEDWTTL